MEMPSVLVRFSLLYNLLTSFFLSFIPKELRSLLSIPLAGNTQAHDHDPNADSKTHAEKEKHHTHQPPTPAAVLQEDAPDLRRQVFEMFDGNGDGKISTKEMKQSLQNMGIFIPDSELVQMMQKVDVNGDGCVDMGEFQVLYQTIMQQQHQQEEEDMKESQVEEDTSLLDAFQVFDKNSDGFISVDELGSVLNSLGLWHGRNEDDCRKMIMKVDVDGDGLVNFNEFKTMMKDSQFSVFSH